VSSSAGGWAERAGLGPQRFAGQSLLAGLTTSAAAGGVSERAVMNQTGRRMTSISWNGH
jgi:hypothetical protein